MDSLAAAAGVAAVAFVLTNVDDLVLLTALFLARPPGRPGRTREVVLGQYVGFGAVLAVSVVVAAGLADVPGAWVGLLGLVPLGLGVRGLVRAARGAPVAEVVPRADGVGRVALLTVAGGGDNVAVYVPLLHALGASDGAVTVVVFLVMVGAWCVLAAFVARRPGVTALMDSAGRWLVPVVYVALGVWILASSLGWTR